MDPSLYLDRDTFVHRLDPRTKMLLLLGTFVLAFVFLNPLYLASVMALVLLLDTWRNPWPTSDASGLFW